VESSRCWSLLLRLRLRRSRRPARSSCAGTAADIAESDGWSGQTNPFVTIVIRRTAVKVEKLFS
jgi:hypothetical protein